MANKYNLSLVFYPQSDGQYHVECPELENCYSCGATKEEARARIYELIAEDLPRRVNWGGVEDEEMFREGFCMKGKIFEEAEFIISGAGEVISPPMLTQAMPAN